MLTQGICPADVWWCNLCQPSGRLLCCCPCRCRRPSFPRLWGETGRSAMQPVLHLIAPRSLCTLPRPPPDTRSCRSLPQSLAALWGLQLRRRPSGLWAQSRRSRPARPGLPSARSGRWDLSLLQLRRCPSGLWAQSRRSRPARPGLPSARSGR